MKRLMIIISLLVAVSLTAAPMMGPLRHQKEEGYGGPLIGAFYTGLASVNSHLESAGYGKIDPVFLMIGGSGYGLLKNRILIGGSGFAVLHNSTESANATAKISGGYGFFETGYAVIKTKHYSLFPMIGIGGGGMNLKLNPQYSGSPKFDDILNDPRRTATLSTKSFAVEIALQNTFTFTFKEEVKNGEIHVAKIGGAIKIGMIYTFNNDWNMDDIDVLASPKIAKEKYFAGLSILFGGGKKKN